MSDNEFISATAPIIPMQTPENTTAPFEGTYEKTVPEPVAKPKRKRSRLTAKQRAAKIASGWNPPGPRPKTESLPPSVLWVAPEKVLSPSPSRADVLLKSLVDRLVALENNAQYRSVWLHFFTHGGVYNGPKYLDELKDAIEYLVGIETTT